MNRFFYHKYKLKLDSSTFKSHYMVFKPNRLKLHCPVVYLNGSIIHYVEKKTIYLGYMFTNDKQDDVEMFRQLHLLHMPSNKIIRMFHCCTIDVKLELLGACACRFTAAIYGQDTRKSTSNRLRLAFNNAYRRILDLSWRCSRNGIMSYEL